MQSFSENAKKKTFEPHGIFDQILLTYTFYSYISTLFTTAPSISPVDRGHLVKCSKLLNNMIYFDQIWLLIHFNIVLRYSEDRHITYQKRIF